MDVLHPVVITIEVGGPAHCGSATGQEVQGCVREQVKQASKQHSSMVSALVPASRFLPQLPCMM